LTYSKVRRRLVETQVLPEFDISTYREFLQLKRSDEALFLTIKERISAAEEDWSLLFAGFDDARAPHIFVISGPGNVQYRDSQKYAAIGSGAFAAIVWMSFYGYHPQKRVGELLFGAMAAKFFAEKASDVGHNTVVSMINSHMNALFHVVNDQEVEAMRTAWEGLPKFSVDSVKELGKKMQELHEMFNRIKQDHPDINK
jgi:hypothetical protein